MAGPKETPARKHILLQKETLQTFDRTWLPGRLSPPVVANFPTYAQYLAAYEQYLHALQHMKGVHMRLTRRDPAAAPPVTVSRKVDQVGLLVDQTDGSMRAVLPANTAFGQFHGPILETPSISFGSLLLERRTVALPSTAGSTFGSWAAETDDDLVSEAGTEVPATPASLAARAAHKRGLKKAARKRRALRRLEARLAKATLTAEVRKAEAKATPRPRVEAKAPKKKVAGKRLSPSALRRLEKRRLARDAAKPPST